MIANITSCKTLLSTVHALGAEPPAALAGILDAYDLVQRSRTCGDLARDLAALMSTEGGADAEQVDAFLNDQAIRYARTQVSREVSETAERIALETFRHSLTGQGGEDLTEALAPTFNAACADLVEVISTLPPGTTAAAAIDAGPDAVAAWGKGPQVAATFQRFVTYALIVGRDLDLVSKGPHLTHPSTPLVAFFLADTTDLDGAARAFTTPRLTDYRGGAFHALVVEGNASLRLHSPADAQRICDQHSEELGERLREGYEMTHGELASA